MTRDPCRKNRRAPRVPAQATLVTAATLLYQLQHLPVVEAAPLQLQTGMITASFTTGMMWSATQYLAAYKTVSVIEAIGDDVVQLSDDLCWHVQEALGWGLNFMVLITVLLYALWCLRRVLAYVTDTERRHRRYAADWPTWYAPAEQTSISKGGWRQQIPQLRSRFSRANIREEARQPLLTGNLQPLAIENVVSSASAVSQPPSWAGSQFLKWRPSFLKYKTGWESGEARAASSALNQAARLLRPSSSNLASHIDDDGGRKPEEGVITGQEFLQLPVLRSLFDEEILSVLLNVVREAGVRKLEVDVLCYGFDHSRIAAALIEVVRMGGRVRILADYRTMYHGPSVGQGDVVKSLLRGRAEVFTFKPDKGGRNSAFHQKTLIVRDVLVMVGSANFTHNSHENCYEDCILTREAEAVRVRSARFDSFWAQGAQVDALRLKSRSAMEALMSKDPVHSAPQLPIAKARSMSPVSKAKSLARPSDSTSRQVRVGKVVRHLTRPERSVPCTNARKTSSLE